MSEERPPATLKRTNSSSVASTTSQKKRRVVTNKNLARNLKLPALLRILSAGTEQYRHSSKTRVCIDDRELELTKCIDEIIAIVGIDEYRRRTSESAETILRKVNHWLDLPLKDFYAYIANMCITIGELAMSEEEYMAAPDSCS